jgi:hypothetical protein
MKSKKRALMAIDVLGLINKNSIQLKKKQPLSNKKKVLFHQDSEPVHKSIKTTAKLDELGYELLLIYRILQIWWLFLVKKRNKKKDHCRNKHDVIQRPGSTEHVFSIVHENPPGIHRKQNTGFCC